MLEALHRRSVAKTVTYLKTLDPKQIDASVDREITFPLGPTNKGHMKGDDYLNHFVLPNFYFHITAAYAILRGVIEDFKKASPRAWMQSCARKRSIATR
jgi:hypothetical protein